MKLQALKNFYLFEGMGINSQFEIEKLEMLEGRNTPNRDVYAIESSKIQKRVAENDIKYPNAFYDTAQARLDKHSEQERLINRDIALRTPDLEKEAAIAQEREVKSASLVPEVQEEAVQVANSEMQVSQPVFKEKHEAKVQIEFDKSALHQSRSDTDNSLKSNFWALHKHLPDVRTNREHFTKHIENLDKGIHQARGAGNEYFAKQFENQKEMELVNDRFKFAKDPESKSLRAEAEASIQVQVAKNDLDHPFFKKTAEERVTKYAAQVQQFSAVKAERSSVEDFIISNKYSRKEAVQPPQEIETSVVTQEPVKVEVPEVKQEPQQESVVMPIHSGRIFDFNRGSTIPDMSEIVKLASKKEIDKDQDQELCQSL